MFNTVTTKVGGPRPMSVVTVLLGLVITNTILEQVKKLCKGVMDCILVALAYREYYMILEMVFDK